MKSSYFKILAVALILAVLAAIGVSQTVKRAHLRADGAFGGGMWGGPGFGGPMLGHLARKLDLTDAQQSQVKGIIAKEKPTFQPLMLQMAQNQPAGAATRDGQRLRRSESSRTCFATDPDPHGPHGAESAGRVGVATGSDT
jgi:Spy/CpxP family protein refolding chaperone